MKKGRQNYSMIEKWLVPFLILSKRFISEKVNLYRIFGLVWLFSENFEKPLSAFLSLRVGID